MANENAPLSRKEEEEKKAAEAQQQSGYGSGKSETAFNRWMNKRSPLGSGSRFKKKSQVSQPGDASEVQADAVAKAVSEGNAHAAQVELENDVSSGIITAKASGVSIETPPGFEEQVEKTKGSGLPLADEQRENLEEIMGKDLGQVRIHDDADSASLSELLRARAFATGNDIYFNSGEFNPDSADGQNLLAHELTHTVQPEQTVSPKVYFTRKDDLINELKNAIATNDKPEYMDSLRKDNGTLAEDLTIFSELESHFKSGSVNLNEIWQAVCILNFGNDAETPHAWPIAVKNFFEGIILGIYTVPAGTMPPRTKDEILAIAVRTAHDAITTGIGVGRKGPFIEYQGKFNALWVQTTYSSIPNKFDPALDSKGPRTKRARTIFEFLYSTDASVKTNYDTDVKAIGNETYKMRELVDQYVGPESSNLIASVRLQKLRELFYKQATITGTKQTDTKYVTFLAAIKDAAENLDDADRQVIASSQEWRIIIEKTLTDKLLQDAMMIYLQQAFLNKSGVATAAIMGVGTKNKKTVTVTEDETEEEEVTVKHTTLTAPQQAFVDGLVLKSITTSPYTVESDRATIVFQAQGALLPAGLTDFKTEISVTPVKHIRGTNITNKPWSLTSVNSERHESIVYTEKGSGSTKYTATLRLLYNDGTEIKPTTPYATVDVEVIDNRENFFKTKMNFTFLYYEQNLRKWFPPGSARTVQYFSGTAPLRIYPQLDGSLITPDGLNVGVNATLKQNGTEVWKKSGTMNPGDNGKTLGDYYILTKSNPDKMELTTTFVNLTDGSKLFHTIVEPFDVVPDPNTASMATQMSTLLAQLKADHAQLQVYTPSTDPRPAKGHSFLDDMLYHGTPQQARVAEAVIAGKIAVEPAIIRPDSKEFILKFTDGADLIKKKKAYALGHLKIDSYPDRENTLFTSAGVGGFHWPTTLWNETIFVVYTRGLYPLVQSTSWDGAIETLTHESVHMIDKRPDSGTPIERYKSEFRAYWYEGDVSRDALSTEFDETMDSFGPKSAKARNIFKHVYNSPAYAYVKENYDANTGGFRDKVNAFIVPDGINVIVSVRIDDLRNKVANLPRGIVYKGSTHQTNVQTEYAKLNADDKQEVTGSRYWRTLAESKGYSANDTMELKTDLGIPF